MIKHLLFLSLFVYLINAQSTITVDGSKLERIFDGIGGLSGGGATSRFLPNYESPYIDEILDYLFLPNFGASLQILKVEIGGDAQSTEGTEASHMHTADDLNYERGYEWWLMQEAKKRNPDIKLYGLTWGVPGWVGGGNRTNYYTDANILYHLNWLKGAKGVYGFDVDYIGVWNERMWNDDWIISFRTALDQAGFNKVQIVAPDRDWGIANDLLANPQLMESVSVVGAHYPGTVSTSQAVQTGKPLWASEDYSSFADSVGGGCWGRILNQNYVNGYMTATISWNLIAAYYNNVPWAGCGLMIASNPWSGHYDVMSPIWITAHTTQFTAPGWIYLAHDSGTGLLPNGGSYVTLVPPNNNGDFSMIIETFTRDHSVCVRPFLDNFTVTPQTVTFQLQGGLKTGPLYVWYSHLTINGENTLFELQKTIQATNGQFTLDLDLDSVVTVSTLTGQQKGQHPTPPDSVRFPTTYADDFNSYNLYSEAKYFDDQTGSFEIQKGFDGSLVMRQMVLEPTVYWCTESEQPISVVGPFSSASMSAEISVYIEDKNGSAALGIKVQGGGCGNLYDNGFYLRIDYDGNWNITGQYSKVVKSGTASINNNAWTVLTMTSSPSSVCGFINGNSIGCVDGSAYVDGFAAIGSSWTNVQFDNFKLNATYLECASGSNIISAYCESGNTNQLWTLNDDGTIRSKTNPNSCISASSLDPNTKNRTVIVTDCNPSDPLQVWTYDGFSIKNPSIHNGCLRLENYNQNDCAPIEVQNCEFGDYSQNWWYNSETQQIIAAANMMCITAGTAA